LQNEETCFCCCILSAADGWREPCPAQPAFEQRSLEEALNPDGTLKQGLRGSFSTKGYTMRTGKNGEPIFFAPNPTQHTASGAWDTQFGLPTPGVAGDIYAVVADGQGNVYAVAFSGW
jgi:hypothetical protein